MPDDLAWFRERLASHEIIDQYPDLFDANSKTLQLTSELARHLKTVVNRHGPSIDQEVYRFALSLLAVIFRSVDGVMALSAFGRDPEAKGLGRRISEAWFACLFISTDAPLRAFVYNRQDWISFLCQAELFLKNPGRFGIADTAEIRKRKLTTEEAFRLLDEEFKSRGYQFPTNLPELRKKYGRRWTGMDTRAMLKAVRQSYSTESNLIEVLDLAYDVGFAEASQMLHGTGRFLSVVRVQRGSRINYDVTRSAKDVTGALLVTLFESFLCIGTIVDRFGLDVSDSIKSTLTDHRKTIDELRKKYYGR